MQQTSSAIRRRKSLLSLAQLLPRARCPSGVCPSLGPNRSERLGHTQRLHKVNSFSGIQAQLLVPFISERLQRRMLRPTPSIQNPRQTALRQKSVQRPISSEILGRLRSPSFLEDPRETLLQEWSSLSIKGPSQNSSCIARPMRRLTVIVMTRAMLPVTHSYPNYCSAKYEFTYIIVRRKNCLELVLIWSMME